MKERPILMSGPLVRKILAGEKTVTRRPLKYKLPLPSDAAVRERGVHGYSIGRAVYTDTGWDGVTYCIMGPVYVVRQLMGTEEQPAKYPVFKCPYGGPGDRLWVKETFCQSPDGPIYRATEEEAGMLGPDDAYVWTPSIFMPRRASRLLLDVKSVRVERLQEITDQDALKEGIPPENDTGQPYHFQPDGSTVNGLRGAFAHTWDRIYKAPSRWEENPWVWRIEFQAHEILSEVLADG